MNLEDASEAVKEYITSHRICHLAVSEGDTPSASTVYYVNRGYSVIFESDSDSHKIQILRANTKVSATIDEDYSDWKDIRGVQIYGKAEFQGEKESEKLRAVFEKKFPWMAELGGIPSHHVLVRIVPEKIYYMDYSKGVGHRTILYPEDMGKTKSTLQW